MIHHQDIKHKSKWSGGTMANIYDSEYFYAVYIIFYKLGQCHNIITCTMIPRVSSAVRCPLHTAFKRKEK